MSTIPADGDIAIGREIILIPKADLQAMKPGITFDQIAERDKKDYALTSDLKIEDNFLSNLIRAGKTGRNVSRIRIGKSMFCGR